jgi:hypothetical protein
MQTNSPSPAPDDAFAFVPVVTRPRADGWTPERQRQFIAALAVLGTVEHAARSVGMSVTGAYQLRRRPDAASFAAAWDAAITEGTNRALDLAIDRGLNGWLQPRFYRDRYVGSIHRFENRMAMAALRALDRIADLRK